MKTFLVAFLAFLVVASCVYAQSSVIATRITNKSAPVIDGVLEDSCWQAAGKLTFPNSEGGCYTLHYQNYDSIDPSTFTVYFLHDDVNLYVAIQTVNDSMIESADYDQNSDGLSGLTLARKDDPHSLQSKFRLLWYRSSYNFGPPLDVERMVYDTEWRSQLNGTWNENNDGDSGYTFEFYIPLNDPAIGSTQGLGGWQAGDSIKANIKLIDHDSGPGIAYSDSAVNFRSCWWGGSDADSLSIPRWVVLSNANPKGEAGDNRTVTAFRVKLAAAPVIDGNPSDPIWEQGGKLRFPNSVGKSFNPAGSQAPYNTDDPSSYTMFFLHDDAYLYVAMKAEDRRIEAAAYDQDSDGLISMVFEVKGGGEDRRYSTFWHRLDTLEYHPLNKPVIDCNGQEITSANLHFQEGPPRYPYATRTITWGPIIQGTWNNDNDTDFSYAFEYRIPLDSLGGFTAGDSIPANIVLADHDANPGGAYNARATHFKKFRWGFDGNEFYPPCDGKPGPRRYIPPEEERFVILSDDAPYGDDEPTDGAATKAVSYLAHSQLEYSGLLRSYPDEMAAHTYDNAVALIALTDGGRQAEAQSLAHALVSVMETKSDEGFFYDSYNVVDKVVGQGTASGTGPNTWAAFALAVYGNVYHDQTALAATEKVTQWVIKNLYDPRDGGVWGGICHPFEEKDRDHQKDTIFSFKSTEQVIDTWHLFRIMNRDSLANRVASWLMAAEKGWVEIDPSVGGACLQHQRFATGINLDCGRDLRLFLDPQSWGSIVANMLGRRDKANGAITAAEVHMRVDTVIDGQKIFGFNDSCLPKDAAIWYGGTAQMVVAYVYNDDVPSASYFLDQMSKVQNLDGSWKHSSVSSLRKYECGKCDSYESFHSAKAHIGETAWNYFALRDVNAGLRLPYQWQSQTFVEEEKQNLPLPYELFQNYPNPFNASTRITFSVPQSAWIQLDLFDLLGHRVFTISRGFYKEGYHTATFNASQLASGYYRYQLKAGSFTQSRMLLLLK